MALRFTFGLLLFAGVAVVGVRANPLIPDDLPAVQKKNIELFLAEIAKQKGKQSFIPKGAKLSGFEGIPLKDLVPEQDSEPRDLLACVLLHRPNEQGEITRASLFWFRVNPQTGKQGVTLKRVVNLASGKQVGPTEVLFNYPTPLTNEEVAEAKELAKTRSTQVQKWFQADKEKVVPDIDVLGDAITTEGLDYAALGDRVVWLQYPPRGDVPQIILVVNLTRKMLYPQNAEKK